MAELLSLIAALRTWFARPDRAAPRWYRAGADPVVGRALQLLHHNPAHPWTVASPAAATGVSRAALARRFTELVGEPPVAFLTGWRVALAADRTRGQPAAVPGIGRRLTGPGQRRGAARCRGRRRSTARTSTRRSTSTW